MREKQISFKKMKGVTNVADIGAKVLEPKLHQDLLNSLPLGLPTRRRFQGILEELKDRYTSAITVRPSRGLRAMRVGSAHSQDDTKRVAAEAFTPCLDPDVPT